MDSKEILHKEFATLYDEKKYIEIINKSLELNVNDKSETFLLYYVGLAYSKNINTLDKGIYMLETVQYSSKNMLYHIQSAIALAYLYIQKEQFSKAFALLDSVIQSGISNSYVYALSGYVCIKRSDYTRASSNYKKSIALDEENINAVNGLASAYIEMNSNLNEALNLSLKAVQNDPNNISFLDTLAMVYYKQKEYTKALETLKQALSIAPENSTLKENFELVKKKTSKK